MKSLKEFIKESKLDLHSDLLKSGMKINPRMSHGSDKSYYTNPKHTHEHVGKILAKHGFEPVTHYKSDGRPMPKPYSNYEKDAGPYHSRHVALHTKDGKLYHMTYTEHSHHN